MIVYTNIRNRGKPQFIKAHPHITNSSYKLYFGKLMIEAKEIEVKRTSGTSIPVIFIYIYIQTRTE